MDIKGIWNFTRRMTVNAVNVLLVGDVTIRTPHTWAIGSEIKVPVGDTDYINPMFVSLPAGQTAKIVKATYQINSGTSVTVSVKKNDVDVTGLTGISVTTTKGSTDPADVTLADGDEIRPEVTAVAGTPTNMAFTLYLENTV